ncbi:hypothetical protein QFZ73_001264 [Peribacillus sp. V2I11]|nr:hypothetical protein [Peribacillus sp. V2I11]
MFTALKSFFLSLFYNRKAALQKVSLFSYMVLIMGWRGAKSCYYLKGIGLKLKTASCYDNSI